MHLLLESKDGNQLIFVKFQPNENVRLFAYRFVSETKFGELIGWTNVQVGENGSLIIKIDDSNENYVAIGEISGEVDFQYKSGDSWRWEHISISANSSTQGPVGLEIYFPILDCAGSRLHLGDIITVEPDTEYVTIRSTPDTHPHDNKIGKIFTGEQAIIIDGPICNYGWILWQVKKNSDGMTGWIPESDGKEFWFIPVQ